MRHSSYFRARSISGNSASRVIPEWPSALRALVLGRVHKLRSLRSPLPTMTSTYCDGAMLWSSRYLCEKSRHTWSKLTVKIVPIGSINAHRFPSLGYLAVLRRSSKALREFFSATAQTVYELLSRNLQMEQKGDHPLMHDGLMIFCFIAALVWIRML